MTREEFFFGWSLLVTQPWGKAYRASTTEGGEPTPADIQIELYYQAVEAYHGEAWLEACTAHAQGERWPSIDALYQSMKLWAPSQVCLDAPDETSREGYITKEQFGLALYEAIVSVGGIQSLDKLHASAIKEHDAGAAGEFATRRQRLASALRAQLRKLSYEELVDLFSHYPKIEEEFSV